MLISSHLLPTSSTLSKSSVSRLVVLLHTFAFSHAASLQGPVPDMVSVGVLAAIINIIVLFIISIADRAIELIIRNFATSRLFRLRRAPVIHDSDTWLLNIPRSLLKYRHNPAIFITIMCTVSLIVGELLSELGVDVSNSCAPITKSGPGISPGKATNNYTIVELGAASFFVQSINFVDGNLTTVRSGTPRRVTGQECLRCMDDIHNPSIISSCSVTLQKVYKKGMLKVSIRKTNGPFGTITSHFINLETGERMRGMGDITRNGAHWASFVVFSRNPQSLDISYIEYANQAHLNALFQKAAGAPGIEIAEETLTEVLEHRVHCGLNELSLKSFLEAIMVYRTIQLENPTVLHYFNDSASRFELLSKEDIYRAVLSLKIIDDQHNASSLYQVYTSCAVYNWYFIIPFLCSLVLVMLLGTTSVIMGAVSCGKYNKSRHGIPYNSHTWFRHVRNGGAGNHALVNSIDKTRSGYFESIFDEMVLEDDGSRGSNYLRIVMCSRGDQNVALEDGLTQEDMGVEEFSAYSQEG